MDEEAPKPKPPNMAWLLTFADLVSLLITFFVLLYSMKVVDESRWDLINGSFRGVFADPEALTVMHPENYRNTDVVQNFEADNLSYLQGLLDSEFARDPDLQGLETKRTREGDALVVRLPSARLFSSGQGNLTRQGRVAVAKLADHMRHLDNRLEVVGYSDPNPLAPDSEADSHWELAMMRAVDVVQVMSERGIQQQVPAVSFGSSRFEEENTHLSRAARFQQARRIEVRIYDDQE